MTVTRHPALTALVLALGLLLGAAMVEAFYRLARADDVALDAGAPLDSGPAIDAGPVAADPPPVVAPPPGVSDIVALWRAGYLAAAVALGLHVALGFALVRWAWLVALLPALGRWKWRAIASSLLAALAVTMPAALTGQLTWPGLVWPVLIGLALAVLPGMPATTSKDVPT